MQNGTSTGGLQLNTSIQGEFTQPRVNYHSSYPSPLSEETKGCYVHINEGSMPSLSSHLGLVPILLLSVVRL